MATKNQIAFTIWIMKRIPILWAKFHKQICLENFWQERVGVTAITRRFAATQRTSGFFLIYCQFAAKTFWLWKSHVVKLIQEWKRIGSGTYDFSLLTLWNPAKRRPTEWEASLKPPYMTLSGSFFCFSWSCLRGLSFWDMWSTWSRKSFRNCEKSRIYV